MDWLIAENRMERAAVNRALLVAESQAGKINWSAIDEWVGREGIIRDKAVMQFYRKIGRGFPHD